MADKPTAQEEALIEQARAQYCNDDLEIDAEPALSFNDEGAWVAAWVWVAFAEIEEEDDDSTVTA
jgi:hypothetical protein